MKNVAEFKRRMVAGSRWSGTHEYINKSPTPPKDFGIRECGKSNSVGFAFKTESGSLSYCSWPKKAEFSSKENTVTIKNEFCILTYTQQGG